MKKQNTSEDSEVKSKNAINQSEFSGNNGRN